MMAAFAQPSTTGPRAAVAQVCAALLLSSAGFSSDLAYVLAHEKQLADTWLSAASAAIVIQAKRPSSAQPQQAFFGDRRVVDELLARLAAAAGAGAKVGVGADRQGRMRAVYRVRCSGQGPVQGCCSFRAPDRWMSQASSCCCLDPLSIFCLSDDADDIYAVLLLLLLLLLLPTPAGHWPCGTRLVLQDCCLLVNLLQAMDRQVLAAAARADPSLIATLLHGLLAVAAAHCSPLRQPADIGSSGLSLMQLALDLLPMLRQGDNSSFPTEQALEQVVTIAGLRNFLVQLTLPRNVAEAGSVQQQLEELGVWRLLEQLVAATGAPPGPARVWWWMARVWQQAASCCAMTDQTYSQS